MLRLRQKLQQPRPKQQAQPEEAWGADEWDGQDHTQDTWQAQQTEPAEADGGPHQDSWQAQQLSPEEDYTQDPWYEEPETQAQPEEDMAPDHVEDQQDSQEAWDDQLATEDLKDNAKPWQDETWSEWQNEEWRDSWQRRKQKWRDNRAWSDEGQWPEQPDEQDAGPKQSAQNARKDIGSLALRLYERLKNGEDLRPSQREATELPAAIRSSNSKPNLRVYAPVPPAKMPPPPPPCRAFPAGAEARATHTAKSMPRNHPSKNATAPDTTLAPRKLSPSPDTTFDFIEASVVPETPAPATHSLPQRAMRGIDTTEVEPGAGLQEESEEVGELPDDNPELWPVE